MSGLKSHSQIAATATEEVITGAKNASRYTGVSLPARCISRAKNNPVSISPGTCNTVNQRVLTAERWMRGSDMTSVKLDRPAKDRVPNPSQW
jgi:hypothetical protein